MHFFTNLHHEFFKFWICLNSFPIIDRAVLAAIALVPGQYARDDALRNHFKPSVAHNNHMQDVQIGDL